VECILRAKTRDPTKNQEVIIAMASVVAKMTVGEIENSNDRHAGSRLSQLP